MRIVGGSPPMVMIPLELSVIGTCQLVVNRASHGITGGLFVCGPAADRTGVGFGMGACDGYV